MACTIEAASTRYLATGLNMGDSVLFDAWLTCEFGRVTSIEGSC